MSWCIFRCPRVKKKQEIVHFVYRKPTALNTSTIAINPVRTSIVKTIAEKAKRICEPDYLSKQPQQLKKQIESNERQSKKAFLSLGFQSFHIFNHFMNLAAAVYRELKAASNGGLICSHSHLKKISEMTPPVRGFKVLLWLCPEKLFF